MVSAAANEVSVIIPAHNAEKSIRRAIKSVAQQTWSPREIIVVDDASTDATRQIVGRLIPETRTPLRLMTSARRGASAARNTGVSGASGSFIAFLDADDVWYPDKLKMQLPLLTQHSFAVGSLMHYLSPHGKVLGTNARYADADAATKALVDAVSMPLALSTWLMPRGKFEAAGGFDEAFRRAQDFEFAVRVAKTGGQLVWPASRILAGYLIHSGGVTAQTYREQYLAAELVRQRHLSPEGAPSYDSWVTSRRLPPSVRRRALSGDQYRKAAVAVGSRRFGAFFGHAAAASLIDPFGVLRKLRWQRDRAGSGALEPASPPREIVEMLREASAPP